MNADAAIVMLLQEIREEIRGLRADLAGKANGRRPLSTADRDTLAPLLPIVHAAVLGRAFTVAELQEHAKLTLPSTVALRDALARITPLKLGKLLGRGAGHTIVRYRITAVEEARSGVRWRVQCGDVR